MTSTTKAQRLRSALLLPMFLAAASGCAATTSGSDPQAGEENCVINPRPKGASALQVVFTPDYVDASDGVLTVDITPTVSDEPGNWSLYTAIDVPIPIDAANGGQIVFSVVTTEAERVTEAFLIPDRSSPDIKFAIDVPPLPVATQPRPYNVTWTAADLENESHLHLFGEEFELRLLLEYEPQ